MYIVLMSVAMFAKKLYCDKNNVSADPKVNMETWEKDMKEQVNRFKDRVNSFKNVVLVGVPPTLSCMKTDMTGTMREKVNKELKSLTKNTKIRYGQI